MNRARVLSATLENFGPFMRADYALADLGLVLVEGRNLDDPGTNSNGSGKSTAFADSITWALFSAARDVPADAVVNDRAGKDCAVTLRLDLPEVGPVTVQRFRRVQGRAGLRLWVGAHVTDLGADTEALRQYERTSADVDATQRQLEDLLGLDLEVWRSAVYRAQHDEDRFAALTDSRQKDLLCRIFQIDAIDQWREAASVRARGTTAKLEVIRARLSVLGAEGLAERVSALQNALQIWEQDRAQRVRELGQELERVTETWKAARARQERASTVHRQLLCLRAAPPPLPPLEAEPARPPEGTLPPMRSRPEPPRARSVQAALPPAPQFPPPPPPPDAAKWRDTAAPFHQEASRQAERARALEEESGRLRTRADEVRARRSGFCQECGGALTPEHADQEAIRLQATSEVADVQARDAREASARAAAQAGSIEALFQQEVRGHEVAGARHREESACAMGAWRREVAQAQAQAEQEARRLEAEDRRTYEVLVQVWDAEALLLQRSAQEANRTATARYEQVRDAARARNAEVVARARGSYEQACASAEAELQTLQGVEEELRAVEARGRAAETALASANGACWPMGQALADLQTREIASREEVARLQQEVVELEHDLRLAEFWVEGLGARGLQSWVLAERLQELTTRTNEWLRVLSGGLFWVSFSTQSVTQRGKQLEKFSTRVFRHRPTGGVAERCWHGWSGGQQARVGIAIDLALADTVAARSRRSWDLLVLDEVFRHLDEGGRETMLQALHVLRRDRGSVVVVDHDVVFKAAFDRRLVVEMRGEESRMLEEPR